MDANSIDRTSYKAVRSIEYLALNTVHRVPGLDNGVCRLVLGKRGGP